MRRNGHSKLAKGVRLQGNVTPAQKAKWEAIVAEAAEVDGLLHPGNGDFFGLLIDQNLPLDRASVALYAKTIKRRRVQDPAAN